MPHRGIAGVDLALGGWGSCGGPSEALWPNSPDSPGPQLKTCRCAGRLCPQRHRKMTRRRRRALQSRRAAQCSAPAQSRPEGRAHFGVPDKTTGSPWGRTNVSGKTCSLPPAANDLHVHYIDGGVFFFKRPHHKQQMWYYIPQALASVNAVFQNKRNTWLDFKRWLANRMFLDITENWLSD